MILLQDKKISICRVITVAPEIVWDILTDTLLWSSWGPSLVDVQCSDRHIKHGSKGRVKTLFSFWLPFAIIEFRQMDFWNWRVGSLEATGHTIIQETDNSCTLCFDMPWWAAVYLPVCWLALKRINKLAMIQMHAP